MTKVMVKVYPDRLKELAARKNTTLSELATACGWDSSYFTAPKIEHRGGVRGSDAHFLCKYLDCTMEELTAVPSVKVSNAFSIKDVSDEELIQELMRRLLKNRR